MSDVIAPASEPASSPAPEAAPSTSEIAAQNFDAFESGTDPGDEAPAASDPVSAPPIAESPRAATVSSEEQEIEALLGEFGFKDARKPDGREHYIPRSKVLKMIGSGLKRGQEKWTTERGVLESQTAELRHAMQQIAEGLKGDPEAILAEFAQVDPRWAAYRKGQPQAQTADPKPEPDLDLGNGARTYSPDGLTKLLEWQVRQVVDSRLSPLEQQAKIREAQQQDHARQQAVQRSIEDATKWPEFGAFAEDGSLTPFQQAVLDTLQRDSQQAAREGRRPSMTLRQAYLEVYAEKRSTDESAVRERVLRELQTAGKAPALSRSASEAPKATGPRTTSDIAARAMARLERGA